MKKTKSILVVGGLLAFVVMAGSVVINNEVETFKSVELGLAEVSPLGEGGGFAVPASGDSIVVYVPKAKLSDTKNPTLRDEEFKVWFGPKNASPTNEAKDADICELYRKKPDGNNWDKIETAGAGNMKSKTQTLPSLGTWHYRTRCAVETNTCKLGLDTNSESRRSLTQMSLSVGKMLSLNLLPQTANAQILNVGCGLYKFWGPWEYMDHKVVPRPPLAEISQNKAVTVKDENFRVTYGPKTSGYAGGVADSCVLQRKHPTQTDWVEEDTSNGITKNPQFSPAILGTWQYRAKCSNEGGSSAWVKLEHLVVDSDQSPTVIIEVRNTTQDTAWTSDDIVIDLGDQVALRWDSTNVSSCTGSNFSTGGNVSGSNNDVTEPAANSNTTYTVACTGGHGNASDSLNVSVGAGTVPEVEVDPSIVRPGDSTTITWKNATGACTLTGPGVNMAGMTESTGSVDVTVNGESTYTITCPGGSDSATVKVLPVIQET